MDGLSMLVGLMIGAVIGAATPPRGYDDAWERIPAYHRALVRSVEADRPSGAHANRRTMSILHPFPAPIVSVF